MRVEIFSDIACPWCYVGKRRFERALEGFEHRDEVSVIWRSFELDPDAPPEREGNYASLLAHKYGRSEEEAGQMIASMTEMGAGEGLELRFDRIRPGNTFDGHRLLQHAASEGKQHAMKERLMRAYLSEGELISDHATLGRLAEEVGLEAAPVARMLVGEQYADRVEAERELAAGFGISAVPFFVVERRFGGAGAQPPEVFASLLEQAWERIATSPGEASGPAG